MHRAAWLLVLLLTACEADRPRPLTHGDRMTIWVEFMAAEDIEAWVAFAGAHRMNLNAAIQSGTHDRAYLARLCAAAGASDVALRLWPLLAYDDGYWVSQANWEAFGDHVLTLAAWAAEDCPRLEGMVLDLEMPFDRAMELQDRLAAGASSLNVVGWLLEGIDEAAFESARTGLAALVDRLRRLGYAVHGSALPMILDDLDDGDESIAKALWTPVLGLDLDVISFQVYRSIFDASYAPALADPAPFTSGVVTSYARTAVAYFGDAAAVDLGTTGTGIGVSAGLASAAALQSDIAAALAEGIPPVRINVFSLEGLVDRDDAAAWLAVPAPAAAAIDPSTEQLRELFAGLDVLDP